jgi:hypothetical protein
VNRNCRAAIQQLYSEQELSCSNVQCIQLVDTSLRSHNIYITNSNCLLLFSKLQISVVTITPNPNCFFFLNYAPLYSSSRRYTQLPLLLDTVHETATLDMFLVNFHECKFSFSHSCSFQFSRPCVLHAPPNTFPRPLSVITLCAAAPHSAPSCPPALISFLFLPKLSLQLFLKHHQTLNVACPHRSSHPTHDTQRVHLYTAIILFDNYLFVTIPLPPPPLRWYVG